ncbi:MAG: FkbM family methyltransferase [Acidobacteriota bacterium]|nr:FkbM family methyltransferase [Acidobacteriota bacterium]
MLSVKRQLKYWLYNSVPGFAGRFPYYGTQVYFPRGAGIFRVVCADGSFEGEIVSRMVRLSRSDATVFDVGANIGLMAIPVLHACPSCRVVSFEPSPSSLPYLQKTVAGSAYRDRWTIVPKAISNQPGEMDFAIGRSHDALFEGFAHPGSGEHSIKVGVTTLDAEWTRLGRPDVSLIKIDVEGAEGLVLDGAEQLCRARRPALVVEWHEDYLRRLGTPVGQILLRARDWQYRIFTIPGGVPVDDADSLRVQMFECSNFLLLPRD